MGKTMGEKAWKKHCLEVMERMEKIREIHKLSKLDFSKNVLGASVGYWSSTLYKKDFAPAHWYMRNLGWYFNFNTNDLDTKETFNEIHFIKKHREKLEKEKQQIELDLEIFN